jgi:pyridoxal phosphate enzyme (YggS family)
VAVSKGVAVDRLRLALDAGIRTFGENRVQEAAAKVPDLQQATWHMVGHLQSNKTAKAAALFSVIESVDSLDLARQLGAAHGGRDGLSLPVYLQVNVDRDAAKAGFEPEQLEADLAAVLEVGGLEVMGLMTVGRFVDRPEDARPTFRSLRELSARLRRTEPRLGPGLSMGMSDDFEVAVEEGATVVRIGRALFGERE